MSNQGTPNRARRLAPAVALGLAMLAAPAHAVDLTITDATPTLIFEDTSFAGPEWYVHGHAEGFSIDDADAGQNRMFINANTDYQVLSANQFVMSLAGGALTIQDFDNRTTLNGNLTLNEDEPEILFDTEFFDVRLGVDSSGVFDAAESFRIITPGTPQTLQVWQSGNVSIGPVPYPDAALWVSPATREAKIVVEERSMVVAPRDMLVLMNPGNTKFRIENTDAGNAWAFTNSGSDFRISLQDSGVVEFRVDNAGDAYLDGALFQNSDRNAKTGIEPVDPGAILDKVVALPIAHWAYRDAPESRHIGPMAQDFHAAFGTGTSDTRLATIDGMGVAMASIQALNEKLEVQNEELARRNAELSGRVDQLEALVMQLLPRTAQQ